MVLVQVWGVDEAGNDIAGFDYARFSFTRFPVAGDLIEVEQVRFIVTKATLWPIRSPDDVAGEIDMQLEPGTMLNLEEVPS